MGAILGRGAGGNRRAVETSLIDQFLYPKLGPGQMWETCAAEVTRRGGEIWQNMEVRQVLTERNRVVSVTAADPRTGKATTFHADLFISSMPIRDLIRAMAGGVPENVRGVSEGLVYRDFITVALLLADREAHSRRPPPQDNWIYIHEPEVRVGRLQIFNNWSPYLVADRNTTWLGLEYFCNQNDALWRLGDDELAELGARELDSLGLVDGAKVLDHTVIRMLKAYPAYFGSYGRFGELRGWLDRWENLFLIGRNGMHRYNNQDHSMLSAMAAVDNILTGRRDRSNIWSVNAEQSDPDGGQ